MNFIELRSAYQRSVGDVKIRLEQQEAKNNKFRDWVASNVWKEESPQSNLICGLQDKIDLLVESIGGKV